MGFINDEEGDIERGNPVHGARLGQLLGREEEEARAALLQGLPGLFLFRRGVRGVDGDGAPRPGRFQQPLQLVFLQGDQRGNDDDGAVAVAVQQQGRHLVDGGFAVPGGHDGEDIAALGQGAHAGELAFTEFCQAEALGRQLAELGFGVG